MIASQNIHVRDIFSELNQVPLFAQSTEADLACLGEMELIEAQPGESLWEAGLPGNQPAFWVLLQGELMIEKREQNGSGLLHLRYVAGDTFGEVPLLAGYSSVQVNTQALKPVRVLRIGGDSFWSLMASCPFIRARILTNMAQRLETYQAQTLHREKLISLGTLAAGLMHELNNPGSAARRASAQLRENMVTLQHLSLKMTRRSLSPEQLSCLSNLQEQVLTSCKAPALSSLEQSDAEEALTEWLEEIGVSNAWRMAPTLVAAGWNHGDIECARAAFPSDLLADALNWLEALISSMQQVSTIEESITRVTDLVTAVKKYAYDGKQKQQTIDVHDSIQGTLTILGHKFRSKQLHVEKHFAPGLPLIASTRGGLSQVWTNLLDNAIDAAPEGGRIIVRTWLEGEPSNRTGTAAQMVCVAIEDNGPGMPPEVRDHIFEPFFTTKPVGVGTGLGLDIAHRIVAAGFSGQITFQSEPGRTEFVVRIPADQKS